MLRDHQDRRGHIQDLHRVRPVRCRVHQVQGLDLGQFPGPIRAPDHSPYTGLGRDRGLDRCLGLAGPIARTLTLTAAGALALTVAGALTLAFTGPWPLPAAAT